jgi:CHAT domain-containing protein
MRKRLSKGQDHPDLAGSLNDLAFLYRDQGKLDDVEPLFKDALEMRKRLFKGQDHPDLAISLNNLAALYKDQGKLDAAEPLLKDALEMRKRLSKGQDHPDLATSLNNLAFLYRAQGRLGDAETLFKDALELYRRLAVAFAQDKTEGETLTLLAHQPLTRDAYLSAAWGHKTDPAGVYAQVWADKGYIARAYERRLLQARAVATDPKAARTLANLTDARRRRAELLLAPASKDPATLAQRKQDIATYEACIEEKTRELKVLLPAIVRADKLAAAIPSDLQQALPAGSAVVDFLQFVHIEHDKDKPGRAGETWTRRYLAFVVTKEKVAWVDLDIAEKIEPAVNAWRAELTAGKTMTPDVAAKVRELIWQKVRQELPAVIKTVYVCPDAALCQVPFAALPGDKPGTILLEDFAVAMIPHAPFLLDKLWPQDPRQDTPANALVVGAVKYDADLASLGPNQNAVAGRGDPLVKPGQKLGWGFLPNTEGEANGIVAAAGRKRLTAVRLEGDKATTAAVLAALPRAKYAHFATHGFFADPSFRSVFDLDPKDFENRGGERVGKAALSPLVMTGLVFAGANHPGTPGRGIVTGEQLIDLDLGGLELVVLSACETGLGDVAGGQGTFGLQRAFHYAGTRDVIASLWKVPDQSTAALMGLFYRNLWTQNLSPLESLRLAQLEIYKNPGKIGELAKGFRGKFEEVSGNGDLEIKPNQDGTAHPLLWAAFTLSGPGR